MKTHRQTHRFSRMSLRGGHGWMCLWQAYALSEGHCLSPSLCCCRVWSGKRRRLWVWLPGCGHWNGLVRLSGRIQIYHSQQLFDLIVAMITYNGNAAFVLIHHKSVLIHAASVSFLLHGGNWFSWRVYTESLSVFQPLFHFNQSRSSSSLCFTPS